MKATLEFDLNEPDDIRAHMRCVKSQDMAITLWEIQYNVKKRCESILENKEDIDKFEALEIVFEELMEIYNHHSVSVDDLII
jgi:hypothetical protein